MSPRYNRDHGGNAHGSFKGYKYSKRKESVVSFVCTAGCVGWWAEPLRTLDRAAAQKCGKCGALGRESDTSAKRRTHKPPKRSKEEIRDGKPFGCRCGVRFRTGIALRLHLKDNMQHEAARPQGEREIDEWEQAGLIVHDLCNRDRHRESLIRDALRRKP